MRRIGLSIEDLLARTWSEEPRQRYLTRIDGLDVLAGQVLALVGPGADDLRERLQSTIADAVPIDGPAAAAAGSLRIHAWQAARIGIEAVTVSDPFSDVGAEGAGGLDRAAAALAVADLAGMQTLDLTTIVDLADVSTAALVADRIVIVDDGLPDRAYPVLAPRPRLDADVAHVTERALARLPAG